MLTGVGATGASAGAGIGELVVGARKAAFTSAVLVLQY